MFEEQDTDYGVSARTLIESIQSSGYDYFYHNVCDDVLVYTEVNSYYSVNPLPSDSMDDLFGGVYPHSEMNEDKGFTIETSSGAYAFHYHETMHTWVIATDIEDEKFEVGEFTNEQAIEFINTL